jgi:glycosyltransferase domain-containing protein
MLTIIIPTFNREAIALSSMNYWSNKKFFEIHFLDGSKNPIDNGKLNKFGSNIHYHHMPIDLFERLSLATEFVNTKYVAMLSDDEFHTDFGISKCIESLENDSSLISCIGHSIGFNFINKNITCFEKYPGFNGYRILSKSITERVNAHMSNYQVTSCYSIFRTDYWRKIIKIPFLCGCGVSNNKFSPPALPEILIELVTSIYGRSKVIPVVYWLRNCENPPLWKNNDNISFKNWWNKQNSKLNRDAIIDKLTKILSNDLMIEEIEIKKTVVSGLEYYILSITEENLFKKIKGKLYINIKSIVPQYFINLFRNNFRVYFDLNKFAKSMKNNGIDCNLEEISFIQNEIIKSKFQ